MRYASYGQRPRSDGLPADVRGQARSGRRRWTAGLVAGLATGLAAVAALVAGCGVPADPRPQPVTPPPQYRTLTPAPLATQEAGTVEATLCLTRGDRLVRVTRPVDRAPTPAELLAELATGANEREREQGLQSAVAGLTSLSMAGIENRVATVAIGESLEGLAFDNQLLVYAQIVCTLDAHPAIDGIFFSRDGERVSVPRGDGTQTGRMLTDADYEILVESTG
jgi:Sporulation and spore germination.